ncbi:MAG TPA: GIY-YIG nuclease family protein [Longimicrobiales bacterium]|nr:GIY-YIG nuclease family protein [Longimicrobiales bacterium]
MKSAGLPIAVLPSKPPSREELRAHVRAGAENRPGIYRMHGPGGEVLYVGKSVQVRTRLLSYFRAARGEKAAEIVGHAHRIEWEHVPSEFAALLRELELIKRWRPPYNVQHKRDSAYCFVKLTREPAPRLLVVEAASNDRALYYGPFSGRQRVRDAVRELCDLLQLRDCGAATPMRFADQAELFPRDETPLCFRGDLHRCLAPCARGCTRKQYLKGVELARRFLEGDAERPLAILHARMDVASSRMQFEYAAELRDRAQRLLHVRDELVALRGTLDTLSFVYHVPGYGGEDRLYLVRRGSVRAALPYPVTHVEREAAARRVQEVYGATEPHLSSVPPFRIAQILLIARWFRLNPEELERAYPPERFLDVRQSA